MKLSNFIQSSKQSIHTLKRVEPISMGSHSAQSTHVSNIVMTSPTIEKLNPFYVTNRRPIHEQSCPNRGKKKEKSTGLAPPCASQSIKSTLHDQPAYFSLPSITTPIMPGLREEAKHSFIHVSCWLQLIYVVNW